MEHKSGNRHLTSQWNEGGHNDSLYYIWKVGRPPSILDGTLVLDIMWELHENEKRITKMRFIQLNKWRVYNIYQKRIVIKWKMFIDEFNFYVLILLWLSCVNPNYSMFVSLVMHNHYWLMVSDSSTFEENFW